MFGFETPTQWLVLAIVAYLAFQAGRATKSTLSPEEREAQRMQAEAAAINAFSMLPPSVQSEVDQLLLAKKKIEAIKLIREHTGLGLKDAKTAAEYRERQIKG